MMSSRNALIGYSGFVGGNIARQHYFEDHYDASNIEDIRRKEFDLIVCAGAPGAKWLANKEPENDFAAVRRLMDALADVKCRKFVLISTIDVFPQPVLGDEDTSINKENLQPYGRHRRMLEEFVQDKYDALIIRLPGIFGEGLKKNIIFDFIHKVKTKIHPRGVFQFYSLEHLWEDISKALEHGLGSLNLATEPISMDELKGEIFKEDSFLPAEGQPPVYEMKTKYASLMGGGGKYLYDKQAVIAEIKAFINAHAK